MRDELIASSHTVDEIATYLRVDSLAYLSLAGLKEAAGDGERYCDACFTGNYPVSFGAENGQGRVRPARRRRRHPGQAAAARRGRRRKDRTDVIRLHDAARCRPPGDRFDDPEHLGRVLVRRVLPLVSAPGRYVGGELGADREGWAPDRANILLAFPDAYEVGMSHQGLKILYTLLRRHPRASCDLAFAPWPDMEEAMRAEGLPLFGLETRRPARHFDLVGFSLGYELAYTNMLTMIDLAGSPLLAADRGEGDPIFVAGGSCAMNPTVVGPFLDLVLLGDGEEAVLDFAEVIAAWKRDGGTRADLLARLRAVDGAWHEGAARPRALAGGAGPERLPAAGPPGAGHRAGARPAGAGGDAGLRARLPLLPGGHDHAPGAGARPRPAGGGRPARHRRGRPRRGLPAEPLDRRLQRAGRGGRRHPGRPGAAITPTWCCPACAWIRWTRTCTSASASEKPSSFTFAPEAGSQRLRDVINKNITEDDVVTTAGRALRSGAKTVKLYFMIGLPTETNEDLDELVALVGKVVARAPRGGSQIHVSISPFAPKSHTPFQWAGQISRAEIERRNTYLAKRLRRLKVKVSLREPDVSVLEGILGLGDARLAPAVLEAWRRGARFDGWTEHFDFARWEEAFAATGIDYQDYLAPRDVAAPLPWDGVDCGVDRDVPGQGLAPGPARGHPRRLPAGRGLLPVQRLRGRHPAHLRPARGPGAGGERARDAGRGPGRAGLRSAQRRPRGAGPGGPEVAFVAAAGRQQVLVPGRLRQDRRHDLPWTPGLPAAAAAGAATFRLACGL